MDEASNMLHDYLNESMYSGRNRSEQDFLVASFNGSKILHFIWGHSLCNDSFQLIKNLYNYCEPLAYRYHFEVNHYICHYLMCQTDHNLLIEKLHEYGVKPSEYIHIKSEIHKSKEIYFIFKRLFPESRNIIWKDNDKK